jgi:hypothetical protein
MSLSEVLKKQFKLKLSPTLLSQLLVFDVQPDDFVEFVAAQVQNIVACKPNCHLFATQNKPVWVLRGYYPNTPVFFKITVVKTTQHTGPYVGTYTPDFTYYVRASELRVTSRKRWHTKHSLVMNGGEIIVMSDRIMENIISGMENSLLGTSNQTKKIISGGPSKPKCMSPKGMKLFRYKKPSNRKKRET